MIPSLDPGTHAPSPGPAASPGRLGLPLVGALALALVACELPEEEPAPELGHVDFQASCAPEVRGDFDRAVALLHHMTYEESRAVFEEIAERDPDCAMAHWGISTTLFQPLWPGRPGLDVRERGWEEIQRAKELGPETERERALVEATAAFWENPESDEWWPRIERWSGVLEAAHEERPDDIEVASFYALSLIGVGMARGGEEQLEHNARAAGIATAVHEREPRHPGAIHYTIHADDATNRAAENLEVVAAYGEVAPTNPHALHMPSHIYVRLGMWPEVIEWNRRSAEAALEHPVNGYTSLHHIHGLDYKVYGHLQRGEDGLAREVLEEAVAIERYQDHFATAYHKAAMPARLAFERRDWEAAAELEPRQPDYLDWDRYPWPEALSWFAPAMGAVMTGDLERAREAEARMAELRDRAEEAGEDRYATYIEVDRLILDGRIALAEGDEETAVSRMEEAARLEGTVQKDPTTPGALLPPYEALGDLLMEMDRPAEALEAYRAGLDIWPGRYHSVLGAARAAELAGEDELAEEYYGEFAEMTADAETDRQEVLEVRERLAAR